jgi:hypothetical protein
MCGTLLKMGDSAHEEPLVELIPVPTIQKRIVVVREHQVNARRGSGGALWGRDRRVDASRQAEQGSLPRRFHVPAHERRVVSFEKPIWHLKRRKRRPTLRPVRLHRAGRRDALRRSAKRAGGSRQHRDHASVVELRRATASYTAIQNRLEELERETKTRLGEHDERLDEIFRVLQQLIAPPPRPKRQIGFRLPEDEE